jgi:hypothetical protein
MLGLIIFFAFAVGLVYYAQRLALRKGRPTKLWMWLTAFFGVFSIAVLALLPRKVPVPES